ncbi:MAG: NAD(P)-binding domain-containing protein, partial [Deltaproteobacteria bacterium]
MKNTIRTVFASPNMAERRPVVDEYFESHIRGLYVVGDLCGAPVIKLAMKQGFEVIEHIASQPDARSNNANVYDLIIAGAGAAGLNAALAAKDKGLRALVLEKSKLANTIENFPEGKWVYA